MVAKTAEYAKAIVRRFVKMAKQCKIITARIAMSPEAKEADTEKREKARVESLARSQKHGVSGEKREKKEMPIRIIIAQPIIVCI